MARIRTIKPDFFLDDEIADLEPLTRLLYVGLWCLADREGRLEDKPTKIRVQILPYDKIDVTRQLNILAERGFIVRYSVQTVKYIQILSFTKHQRIHHTEIDSVIPPLDHGDVTVIPPLDHGEPPPKNNSNPPVIKEGKGRERKGVVNKTLIPPDFKISDRVKLWAQEKKHSHLDQHLESFIGKCRAKGYEYIDWDEAFMEAIRSNWANVKNRDDSAPGKKNGSDPFTVCPRCKREVLIGDLTKYGCLKCEEPTEAGREAFKKAVELVGGIG